MDVEVFPPRYEPSTEFTRQTYIPVAKWGHDHLEVLAKLSKITVEDRFHGIVGEWHPRFRRRNLYVFERSRGRDTRLNDGTFVRGHKEWDCIIDFAHQGLLTCDPGVRTDDVFKLTLAGLKMGCDYYEEHELNDSPGWIQDEFRTMRSERERIIGDREERFGRKISTRSYT